MRITEQILAKLGPELRQSRDPKRRPLTPGPQRVRSVERETSLAPSKDPSKSKRAEKAAERNRGHHPLIGADREAEMGHHSATSVKAMDTS